MKNAIVPSEPSSDNLALVSRDISRTRQMIDSTAKLTAKLYGLDKNLEQTILMKHIPFSQHLPQTPWLILFDGVCEWCTGWVRFLITRDTGKRFQFTPLQSPLGQQFLSKYELPQQEFSTFVVITPDGHLTKSTAALNIARQLEGLWPIFSVFLLLPKNLRDGVYDFIARHRYQLRGTLDACYVPPEEYRDRFRYDA